MFYQSPFQLSQRSGNNIFAFELRNPAVLTVPACREGSLEDVRPGQEVVFADHDENGELQLCKGLEFFVKTEFEGVPMVVFDNHNHCFYFWAEAMERGVFEAGLTLIHVDQHRDSREPDQPYTGSSLAEAFDYTNQVLNVGNYIDPALKAGWFSDVVTIMGEADLDKRVEGDFVLNIDLDFFAPELDYIPFKKARQFLRDHARRAKFITMATSPFFIDQERAIQKL
jgi:hypothetical protein